MLNKYNFLIFYSEKEQIYCHDTILTQRHEEQLNMLQRNEDFMLLTSIT